MSIKIEGVSKYYGEQAAVKNISFEVAGGEVVGFLGPNGAGKSTTMKILTCFIPPSSGKASVCGYDVIEASMEVRKRVGYLPEHNPLYLDMYVKEFLHFVAGVHKLSSPSKRVDAMIELVGLGQEQHKQLGALSKGYRQRVGLAQAMLHDPEVLILDEPTSGLDPNQLVEIRKLISTIGESKTVLLSTHIMQEVEAICNRVMIINRGEIVADDSASALARRMNASSSVVLLELDAEVQVSELEKLRGVQSVRSVGPKRWELEVSGSDDIRKEIAQWAQNSGYLVLALQESERKLEDVFKALTASS